MTLGLLDDHGQGQVWPKGPTVAQAALNPLARPLAAPLSETLRPRLAEAALPPLAAAWRDPEEGGFPHDPRAVEAARLALLAPAPEPAQLERAAPLRRALSLAGGLQRPRGLRRGCAALARLESLGHPPHAVLIKCRHRRRSPARPAGAAGALDRPGPRPARAQRHQPRRAPRQARRSPLRPR